MFYGGLVLIQFCSLYYPFSQFSTIVYNPPEELKFQAPITKTNNKVKKLTVSDSCDISQTVDPGNYTGCQKYVPLQKQKTSIQYFLERHM